MRIKVTEPIVELPTELPRNSAP